MMIAYVPFPELWGKVPENYRFEHFKNCPIYVQRDWRSHGHGSDLLVKLSVKLKITNDAIVKQIAELGHILFLVFTKD